MIESGETSIEGEGAGVREAAYLTANHSLWWELVKLLGFP